FMGKIEEETARLPEAEKAVKSAKEEFAKRQQEGQERIAGLKQQLEEALREISQVESTLPLDIGPQYKRLVGARGEDAMAAVQGRTCQACYTEITAQNYNDLMLSQFVLCKSCGRVLYLPD